MFALFVYAALCGAVFLGGIGIATFLHNALPMESIPYTINHPMWGAFVVCVAVVALGLSVVEEQKK